MTNNINGHSGKGPTAGNPNKFNSVFESRKRRKTHETSSPRKPGPSDLSRQGFFDGSIDLTNEESDLPSRSSTATGESEDSLNLGAAERSKRIVDDGRATRLLKADRRGGEPSKLVNIDTETDPIDEFPGKAKKETKVLSMARNFELNGGKPHTPKLRFNQSNPLDSLPPVNHRPKACLFTEEEGCLADTLITRSSLLAPLSLGRRSLRMGPKARGQRLLCYL